MNANRLPVFLALLLAAAAAAAAAAAGGAAPPDDTAPRDPADEAFPTYGVALAAPDGWSKGPVNSPGRIVSFGLAAADKGDKADGGAAEKVPLLARVRGRAAAADRIAAVLNVDVSWVDVPSLQDFADRQMDGGVWAVTDPDATLGGEPAVRLRSTAQRGPALRYADMMAATHDGRLYLVSSMDTAGHPARAEFDALCASWRWVEVESPAGHLEFRDEPFPVLDGAWVLNAPAVLRPMPTEHPKRHAKLVAYNLAGGGSEDLVVDVGVVKKPAGQTLDAFREALSEGLRRQFKLRAPPGWEDRRGSPPRSATPAVSASIRGADGVAARVRFRLAMVDAGQGRFVLIHFRIAATSAEDRAAYEEAVEKIIDSVGRGVKRP